MATTTLEQRKHCAQCNLWQVRGVPVPPLFGLGHTRTPTFQDTGEEFAVVRGDLRRLNYTETVSATDPAREFTFRLS